MSAKAAFRLIVCALALVIGIQTARVCPTTVSFKKGKCPVCGEELRIVRLGSYNTFGDFDTDLFCRSIPISAFPITCLKCKFSSYADEFQGGVEFSDSLRRTFREGNLLFPRGSIAKANDTYDIPAWIRYDLLIQTNILRGIPEDSCLSELLDCSWAIRDEFKSPPIDTVLLNSLLDTLKLFQSNDQMDKSHSYRPAFDVLKFLGWAQNTNDRQHLAAMLVAANFLRYRGETDKAWDVFNAIRPDAPLAWIEFIDSSETLIATEKYYQRRALTVLERRLKNGRVSWDNCTDRYLSAELARRTGNLSLARARFTSLLQESECDSVTRMRAIEQIERIDEREQELLRKP
jgi:hypothetical protein